MIDVHHRVSMGDANAHMLAVESTFRAREGALPSPLVVFMPVWTPGSYLVREYARNVEKLAAAAEGSPLAARKVRKNAWAIEHDGLSEVRVRYEVYANDLTVRTNHVDASHAYWNGAATYLCPEASPDAGAKVTVAMPPGWSVATPLAPLDADGPTTFVARDFDELCDSPFECGKLVERRFTVLGKPHRIAAWDNADAHAVDWDALVEGTTRIVETEAALLAGDGDPATALPYESYLFLWHVSPRGRGGLEHASSSTMIVRPDKLATRAGWVDLLALVAHEFLHLWNVKRIRPAGLSPYRYERENYTRLLWWFEGATSYFDFRVLRLAGLATGEEYRAHLAECFARLEDTPGARVHALADASFDAWIKLYRPDENSLNSTVSYYLKGEVVCALFDLEIRARTSGRRSLDDVLRWLWKHHGATGVAVPEDGMRAIFEEVSGVDLGDLFESLVERPWAIDPTAALASVGLAYERTAVPATRATLGVRTSFEAGRLLVDAVPRGSAAHLAGIDPHDEIIAVDERRVQEGRLDAALAGWTPGSRVSVLVARDGRLVTLEATLDAARGAEGRLVPLPDASPKARRAYEAWLDEPFPAPAKPDVS